MSSPKGPEHSSSPRPESNNREPVADPNPVSPDAPEGPAGAVVQKAPTTTEQQSAAVELATERRRRSLLLWQRDESRLKVARLTRRIAELSKAKRREAARGASIEATLSATQRKLRKATKTRDAADRAVSRLKRRNRELARDLRSKTIVSIGSTELRDWLCERSDAAALGYGNEIPTLGSGPFEESEFDDFLRRMGFAPCLAPNPDARVIIVGRDQWSPKQLLSQVEARDGSTIRVFSQELFVLALATGADPFTTANAGSLESLGAAHPALSLLMKHKLHWPDFGQPGWDISGEGMSLRSPLRELGYRVGRSSGLSPQRRRAILRTALDSKLPWVTSDEYMAAWGRPASQRRLFRIAIHLWAMATLHPHLPRAVEAWTRDLAWMRKQFYRGDSDFEWPGLA